MTDVREIVARAAREEIVRQHRDNDRAKWPAGAYDYEEHQSPFLVAEAILSALAAAGFTLLKDGEFYRGPGPPQAATDQQALSREKEK